MLKGKDVMTSRSSAGSGGVEGRIENGELLFAMPVGTLQCGLYSTQVHSETMPLLVSMESERPDWFAALKQGQIQVEVDLLAPEAYKTFFAYIAAFHSLSTAQLEWSACIFPISPVKTRDGSQLSFNSADARMQRNILRYLCKRPNNCEFVCEGPDNEPFSGMLKCEGREPGRLRQITEILDYLDHREVLLEEDEFNVGLQEALCGFPYWLGERWGGSAEFIYTMQSTIPGFARKLQEKGQVRFIRHKVAHNRLIEHTASEEDSRFGPPLYDIFLSHAHADRACAENLIKWMKEWKPDIRAYLTPPDAEERFVEDPSYFLVAARRSRVMIYMVTPISLMRPFVNEELGTNVHKSIICLLLGNVTSKDVESKLENNPFVSVDADNIFTLGCPADWQRFARKLAKTLDWPSPQKIPPPPRLTVKKVDIETAQQVGDRYKDVLTQRNT